MTSKKKSASAEGKNLLDAYEWFDDQDVMQSFVQTALTVAKEDFKNKENIIVMGIGSGTATLEAEIDKQLKNEGLTPTTIATDAITQPSDEARDSLDEFFLLKNRTMTATNEETVKETSLKILDSNGRVIDDSVDLVLARSVTHYEETLEKEKVVLQQVRRILKSDGVFVTQAPTPALPEERKLFIEIHKVLPKLMNVQTKDETLQMLSDEFGEVRESEFQTDKKLTINSGDFYDRYKPQVKDCESQESLEQARNDFSQKVEEVKELIAAVPEKRRPNIWIDSDTFGWSVPYTIFICSQ